MNNEEARRLGAELARQAQAAKTLACIEADDACYPTILRTALAEVGTQTLIKHVCQGPPEWAYRSLLYVPVQGPSRDALIHKTCESPTSALSTLRFVGGLSSTQREALAKAAGPMAAANAPITSFRLQAYGGYACQFTLNWIRGGMLMPASGYQDWNDWHWSSEVTRPRSTDAMAVVDFKLPNAPIERGDLVWMQLWVRSGRPLQATQQFIYDPDAGTIANFRAEGTTTSDQLVFVDTTSS